MLWRRRLRLLLAADWVLQLVRVRAALRNPLSGDDVLVDEEVRGWQDDRISFKNVLRVQDVEGGSVVGAAVESGQHRQLRAKRLLPTATTFGEDVRLTQPLISSAADQQQRDRAADQDQSVDTSSADVSTAIPAFLRSAASNSKASTFNGIPPFGDESEGGLRSASTTSSGFCPIPGHLENTAAAKAEKRALCREYAFLLFGGLAKLQGKTTMAANKKPGVLEGASATGFVDAEVPRNGYELHVFRANGGRRRFDVFLHSWALAVKDKLRNLYAPVLSVFEQNSARQIEIARRIWPYAQRKCYRGDYFCIAAQSSMSLSFREVINLMLAYEEAVRPYDRTRWQVTNCYIANNYPRDKVTSVSHTGDHHWVFPGSRYAARFRMAWDYRWSILRGGAGVTVHGLPAAVITTRHFQNFWADPQGMLPLLRAYLGAGSAGTEEQEVAKKALEEQWRLEDEKDLLDAFGENSEFSAGTSGGKGDLWRTAVLGNAIDSRAIATLDALRDVDKSTLSPSNIDTIMNSSKYYANLRSRYHRTAANFHRYPEQDMAVVVREAKHWLGTSSWLQHFIRFNVTPGAWPAQDVVCDLHDFGLHHAYALFPPLHWRDVAYLGIRYGHFRETSVHAVEGYEDRDVYAPLKHHEDQLVAVGVRSGKYGVALRGNANQKREKTKLSSEGFADLAEGYEDLACDEELLRKLERIFENHWEAKGLLGEKAAALEKGEQLGKGSSTNSAGSSGSRPSSTFLPAIPAALMRDLVHSCSVVTWNSTSTAAGTTGVTDEAFWFDDDVGESHADETAEQQFARIERMERYAYEVASDGSAGSKPLANRLERWRGRVQRVVSELLALERQEIVDAERGEEVEYLGILPSQQYLRVQLVTDNLPEEKREKIKLLLKPFRGGIEITPESIANRRDRHEFLPYFKKYTRIPAGETPAGRRLLRQTFGKRQEHQWAENTKPVDEEVADTIANGNQTLKEKIMNATPRWRPFMRSGNKTWTRLLGEIATMDNGRFVPERWLDPDKEEEGWAGKTSSSSTEAVKSPKVLRGPQYSVLDVFPTVKVIERINEAGNGVAEIKTQRELRHHFRESMEKVIWPEGAQPAEWEKEDFWE